MSRLKLVSIFLISVLFHSSLSPDEGSDLWYYYSFQSLGVNPLEFIRLDNGFYVMLKFLMPYWPIKISIALMVSFALVVFINSVHKISGGTISVFYILLLVPMIGYLSGIRSFIATSLVLSAWSYISEEKRLLFVVCVVSSLWFHLSVLPAVLAILLIERKIVAILISAGVGLFVLNKVDLSFYYEKFIRYSDLKNDLALQALSSHAGRISYLLQYCWIVALLISRSAQGRSVITGLLLLNSFSWDSLFRSSYYVKPIGIVQQNRLNFFLRFCLVISFLVQIWTLRDLII